jgi:2-dehydro-3-deoxygluconokinase
VTRVLVVGEPLVELREDPVGTIRQGFGGDALNLAVSLKRASPELDVLLASAVGDGSDSDALLALCRDEGIDVSLVRRVAGAELGRYRVTVDAAGERSFTYDRSASPFRGVLDAGDVLPDGSEVDVLCFSGIAMAVLHEAGRLRLLAYATAMHERGGTVVYDPNHRPALWADDDDARAWTGRIVPAVDVLLASTEDGRRLTGDDTPGEIADAFRAMGAREVVVTDGADPCVVAVDVVVVDVAPIVPRQVIDTTAAGDAFDAGYLAARLRGGSPSAGAAAGHAAAAEAVAHRGALAPRPGASAN